MGLSGARPSFGDLVVWFLYGNPLGLAPEWGALWVLVLVLSVDDATRLTRRSGQALLVLRGGRLGLWADLCVITVLLACAGCMLPIFVGDLILVALGGAPTLELHCIFEATLGSVSSGASALDVAVLLALVLVGAMSLCLFEQALSLCVGRTLALVATVALLLGSAYLPTLPLPGSWLMASRLDLFGASTTVTSVWPCGLGLCSFVAIGVLAVLIGGRIFRHAGRGNSLGRVRGGRGLRLPQVSVHRPNALAYCAHAGFDLFVVALAASVTVAVCQCVLFASRVALYVSARACPGFADFAAYVFLGSSQPDPLSATVGVARYVTIPFGWLATVLVPLAWTYLFARRTSQLDQPTVLCSGRRRMWTCRCLVTAVASLALVVAELLVCVIAAAVAGGDMSCECSSWFADVAGLARETLPDSCEGLPFFLASYSCMGLAICLGQLCLSELFGAMTGLVVSVVEMAGSVFLMSPALLGNYLMSARSAVFVVAMQTEVQGGTLQAGLNSLLGVLVAVLLAGISLLAGMWRAGTRELSGGLKHGLSGVA